MNTIKNNILVKQLDNNRIESTIIVQRGGKKNLRTDAGVIIAVPKKEDSDYIVGEKVFFGKFSGVNVRVDGEEYILLSKREVLGSFDPERLDLQVINTTNVDGLLHSIEMEIEKRADKSRGFV